MSIPRTAAFLAILSVLCGCLGTHRISRPELSGFVYDAETGKPLRGCKVGEASTDAKGYFRLPRKTSPKTSFEGSKPRPLVVSEFVIFQGYEMVRLYSFKPWGVSGLSSPLEVNPIFLRRLNSEEKKGTDLPWREVSVSEPLPTARRDSPSPLPDQ
jgi:hypothetical protein